MALPGHALERRKRFYSKALAAPVDGGWAVQLDGRTARAPDGGRPLVAPTKALAELIAAEWEAQVDEINPATMPATALGWAAVVGDRGAAVARVAGFAASDLICYFADSPASLVARQAARWEPMIAWAERALEVTFVRATGIIHKPQPEATIQRIEALASAEDGFALAALSAAAGLFGSAILAFAVRRGEMRAEAAFDLSRLDERFQEERWGVDAEAAARTASMAAEAATIGRWFAALG